MPIKVQYRPARFSFCMHFVYLLYLFYVFSYSICMSISIFGLYSLEAVVFTVCVEAVVCTMCSKSIEAVTCTCVFF